MLVKQACELHTGRLLKKDRFGDNYYELEIVSYDFGDEASNEEQNYVMLVPFSGSNLYRCFLND